MMTASFLLRRGLPAVVICLAGASSAYAAQGSGTAKAKLLQAITATEISDADFATIVPGTAASTVTLSSTGARTCGAGLVCTGTATAPRWQVTATGGAIIYWNGDTSINVTSGSNSMTVSILNMNSIHTMPASGTDAIGLGAILNVGANQPAGNYVGTFNIEFTYN